MSSSRHTKRVRQACEPCRRKKSRCLGERPTCSHCARLRQPCHYANESRSRNMSVSGDVSRVSQPLHDNGALEARFRSMEGRINDLLANQVTVARSESQHLAGPSPSGWAEGDSRYSSDASSALPTWDIIRAAGECYLAYCDCQPLPLFHRGTFINSLTSREPELLYAILGISTRFFENQESLQAPRLPDGYGEASRARVMKRIVDGCVELSTLQSLCLLTLIDFSNGNTRRASLHSSLGISLAQSAGLTMEANIDLAPSDREERRRCFWSLFLLKRLHGADFGTLDFTGEETFPWYPETTGTNNFQRNDDIPSATTLDGEALDKGIVAYAVQLSEVWFKITKYARRRGKPSALPPWSPQSEYAIIMAQQMESETRMPYVHRFKPSAFNSQTAEELQMNRDYWGPWLFVQILYHTNLCLLNHPLLLSLRLRTFKSMIPEIFLQHTSDLISSHSSWIMHLISILEAKSFKVTDPFLGYCVAIIATIYLQESFVDDLAIRTEKQDKFSRCLSFVRGFGKQWPHVARIADKLQRLGQTVSSTCELDDGRSQPPNRSLLIDLGQLWEILEYASSSEGSPNNLFGPTLSAGFSQRRSEMASTSALPLPTRVDAQGNTQNEARVASSDGVLVEPVPLLYSDDELAVLAESFFQVRPDIDDGADEWWTVGNL